MYAGGDGTCAMIRADVAPEMQPTPQSSSVEAIGYDAEARELWVTFRDSGTYVYSWVREELWRRLVRAESKGTFVNTAIKPDHLARRV